jgi:lysophospholipase L1-like esterase
MMGPSGSAGWATRRLERAATASGLLVLLLGSAFLAACDGVPQGDSPPARVANTATIAVPREDGMFVARQREIAAIRGREKIELVFIGDSITQRWEDQGRFVWNRYYGSRNAANLGVNADRTQHVLWRIRNGNLSGMRPRIVVLLIGTNNTPSNDDAEIVEGVLAVVDEIEARVPDTRILLLGLFPKSPLGTDPVRARIERINATIAEAAAGRGLTFLDIGHVFLAPDGSIPQPIMFDALHLSARGYTLWAEAIEPTLVRMLE